MAFLTIRGRAGLVMLLATSILAGCGAPAPTVPATQSETVPPRASDPTPSASVSTGTSSPSAPASAAPPPTPTATPSAPSSCAGSTFASLTEPQRIGQLFIIGLHKDRLDDPERAAIARYHFGSVTFTTQTSDGVAVVRATTDAVQALATRAATGGVRFIIAANQEGGRIQGLSGPGFDPIPSALEQGTMTPAALRRAARRWGDQLGAAGVNLDFAPVADVVPPGTDAQNAPIGQLQREFGHDPATVASHVTAFIRGMGRAGIATTAKHFPGLGRVAGNTDFTSAVNDAVTTRNDPYLLPFQAAVEASGPFVMVSLATYEQIDPDHLAAFSRTIVTGVLRGDLGFEGVVVSDALGAKAVASIPAATRAIDFLRAGGDMLISNQIAPAEAMADAIAARAAANPAFRTRVDEAVLADPAGEGFDGAARLQ